MQKAVAMTIATPNELDYNLALRAHSGTSFVPEDRARHEQREYVNELTTAYDKLLGLCASDQQRAVLDDEFPRFKANYLRHYGEYLASRGRLVSVMIAGPSRFPAERMNKRANWCHNKLSAFLEWKGKALEAIQRRILDARTTEEVDADEWRRLRRDIMSSLSTIKAIDDGASFYTRSLFVSSIVGKVERLAANGRAALVCNALKLVKEYNDAATKPAITNRHKFWGLLDIAENAAAKASEPVGSAEPILEAGGVQVVRNHAADRVQIIFPGKPDASTRSRLKSSGWRWSPSESAWQRKLTNAAEYDARQIVGCLCAVVPTE